MTFPLAAGIKYIHGETSNNSQIVSILNITPASKLTAY